MDNFNHHRRDELVELHQYNKKSVADFVFCFCETCLKIDDLSNVEKLNCFVRALVPEIQLQVELCKPLDFHGAVMYAERSDALISCVSGQDVWKPWQK